MWAVECDQPEVILFEVEYKVTTDIVSYDVIVSTNIRPASNPTAATVREEKSSVSQKYEMYLVECVSLASLASPILPSRKIICLLPSFVTTIFVKCILVKRMARTSGRSVDVCNGNPIVPCVDCSLSCRT